MHQRLWSTALRVDPATRPLTVPPCGASATAEGMEVTKAGGAITERDTTQDRTVIPGSTLRRCGRPPGRSAPSPRRTRPRAQPVPCSWQRQSRARPPTTWPVVAVVLGVGSTSNTPSGCSSRPWAGRAETPYPGRRKPLDLAHGRGLHPAAAGPAPRHRSSTTLGETRHPTPADPRAGPTRISPPPREHHSSRQSTETLPTRSGRPPRSRNRHRAAHHDVGKHLTSGATSSSDQG